MSAPDLDCTIIIAQHQQIGLTEACITSFRAAHGSAVRILLADDGSGPEVLRRSQDRCWANAEVIALPARCGVTRAWNEAARHATTSRIVFLNNDVVSDGVWLEPLLAPLDEPGIAICGVELRRETRVPVDVQHRLPVQEFLSGWCFGLRRQTWKRLGGFDESMRLYFSDTDLQCRIASGEAGTTSTMPAIVTGLPLRHRGAQTTSRLKSRRDDWHRDRRRFLARWGSTRPLPGRSSASRIESDIA